jgi:hypothetical protein
MFRRHAGLPSGFLFSDFMTQILYACYMTHPSHDFKLSICPLGLQWLTRYRDQATGVDGRGIGVRLVAEARDFLSSRRALGPTLHPGPRFRGDEALSSPLRLQGTAIN